MNQTIAAIGELLIDFIPEEKGCALSEVAHFTRVAGGAPANVVCTVARLGGSAAMISQVGNDAFGSYLIETLVTAGVDTTAVFRTSRANTGLAFVSLDAAGNRDFSFYRNPSADLLLEEAQISPALFRDVAVLHFCSVDLVDAPVRQAHRRAIALAKEAGALISFDPNVRLPLWDDPAHCAEMIREFLPLADLVKISDNELEFLLGTADPVQAANELFALGVRAFLYTKGPEGAEMYTRKAGASEPALPVEVVDTTGAGDSFVGALLFSLAKAGIDGTRLSALSAAEMQPLLRFASAYAACTTTKRGAAASLADADEFAAFCARHGVRSFL